MLCARINPITLKEQSVKEHSYNVSQMSKGYGAKISAKATAELIGVFHDMGKQTKKFDSYMRYCVMNPDDRSLKGTVDHSTAGARFIYDNFYGTKDPYQKLTAQLISLVICSHHGGLIDCLDLKGIDKFTSRIKKTEEIFYDEALSNFMPESLEIVQANNLFNEAKKEIKDILLKINKIDKNIEFGQFAVGMLVKYLFSCLIDADRYDTYLFMENKKPNEDIDKLALWNECSIILETKLNDLPKLTEIDFLREEISIACKNFGYNYPGVYQLSVPTGGGKTFSSLRYALEHAKEFNKERIFYIIPFTTIIDQNAKDIKDILGRKDIILEHHSNLVVDDKEEHELLIERWDSPIIFTTMVQFLNTLFSDGTQSIRRMHNLTNSVIIFDEIQTIPIKCISMFNDAINFLSNICNATIILSTATQPLLSATEKPLQLSKNPDMVPNIHNRFAQLKRVNLNDKRIVGGYSMDSLKEFVLDKMEYVENVLVVLNTKSVVREFFKSLKKANEKLPKEKQFFVFHLSTGMCPSHRMNVLGDMKKKLGHKRMVCISTQLIEAGVNISFECVVRSLAGLDSIIQAAGRCNRHGEKDCGEVYIVNVEGENVSKLIDIKKGQEVAERVLDEFRDNPGDFDDDLLSQKVMDRYYKYYFYDRKKDMNYVLLKPHNDRLMYDLLAGNKVAADSFNSRNGFKSELMLKQAFKTAGNNFQVIDQNTVGIIVPYKKGKKLIISINGECSLSELKQYLREAQQFSINLFETEKRKLEEMGGIIKLKDGVAFALRDEFYERKDIGVIFEGAPMEFCGA